MRFKSDHLVGVQTRAELIAIANENDISIGKTLDRLKYEAELKKLQAELVNLQKWIAERK